MIYFTKYRSISTNQFSQWNNKTKPFSLHKSNTNRYLAWRIVIVYDQHENVDKTRLLQCRLTVVIRESMCYDRSTVQFVTLIPRRMINGFAPNTVQSCIPVVRGFKFQKTLLDSRCCSHSSHRPSNMYCPRPNGISVEELTSTATAHRRYRSVTP